jgi:hypothetical protein
MALLTRRCFHQMPFADPCRLSVVKHHRSHHFSPDQTLKVGNDRRAPMGPMADARQRAIFEADLAHFGGMRVGGTMNPLLIPSVIAVLIAVYFRSSPAIAITFIVMLVLLLDWPGTFMGGKDRE